MRSDHNDPFQPSGRQGPGPNEHSSPQLGSHREDPDLRKLLGDKGPCHNPDNALMDKALHRALIAFRNNQSSEPSLMRDRQTGFRFHWLPLSAGLALGCLLMWLFMSGSQSDNLAVDRKLLAELKGMFPGQLQAAVIYPGKDLRLLVNPTAAGSSSQPLVIELSRNGQHVKVLTFSGSNISVDGFAELQNMEVLARGDGGVLLVGVKGVMDLSPSQNSQLKDGLTIRAQCL